MGTQPYSAAAEPASGKPGSTIGRPVVATIMLVALLSLFFSAGFWQLDRADQKRRLQDNYVAAGADEVLRAPVEDEQAEEYRFRRFELRGRYLPERQILLDNMTDGGSNGYQVVTPFQTDGRYVLVNRGWVAANQDRQILPDIGVSAEQRTIVAQLNFLPAPGLLLGQSDDTESWPRRLLFPDRAQLEQTLGLTLPDYQLQLDPAQIDGYLRIWQTPDNGAAKHLGYAFQWFSFAALACIFYLILMYQWFRNRNEINAR